MQIILASNSVRRKHLLNKIGLDFIQAPSSVIESNGDSYYTAVATVNAIRKAQDVAVKYPDALVIGADTVIEYKQEIIGKPGSLDEAKNILLKLSNDSHFVVSAVSLQSLNAKIRCTFAVRTEVHFKAFTADIVNEYLSLIHVLDKAGAYAIQEHGEMLIDFIEGPLDNVIGLPCQALQEALNAVSIIWPRRLA